MYKKLGAVITLAMTLLFGLTFTVHAQTEGVETESTKETETNEDTQEVSLENTFTEDGNASLGDTATSSDQKEFITVTTKNGNTFYLIIDHQRDSNNVYFLNMVDENDLKAFLDENAETGLDSIVSLPKETEVKEEPLIETVEETKETESTDVVADGLAQAAQSGNINYLIVIVVVGVFGVAYYFKIYKKKAQPYDEYESEDEYEEDMDYEEDDANYEEEEISEEESEEETPDEMEIKLEADHQAKLEEERRAKLEAERLRKEQLKEKQKQLQEEESRLKEDQERLVEQQKSLAEQQDLLMKEQKEFEENEEDVF